MKDHDDLYYIHVKEFFLEDARKAWLTERNPFVAMMSMSNTLALDFVWWNSGVLKKHGKLAPALLEAWTGTRVNFSQYNVFDLQLLFMEAGREEMLRVCNKLPHNGPFELYRGVNGNTIRRKVKGLSWTDDFEKAKWFAKRYKDILTGKPAVFKITAPIEWVWGYYTDRNESEFILLLPPDAKPKCIWKAE